MPATHSESRQSDPHERSRQQLYRKVIRIVQANTPPVQSPVCHDWELATVAGHCNIPRQSRRSAVRAAVRNSDLFALADPRDGQTILLIPPDVETLRRCHEWFQSLETEISQDVHAWLNERIAEVKDA